MKRLLPSLILLMFMGPSYAQDAHDRFIDNRGDDSKLAPRIGLGTGFFTYLGEPYDDAEFSGRSDYQAFINNGIPSGGLFTGAEVVKTPEQEAIWGGTAGQQFDPCYHLACDTFDNVDLHALEVNADATAVAVLTYAFSTESVNGVSGKEVPGGLRLPPPAGPEGTVGGDGGAHFDDAGE